MCKRLHFTGTLLIVILILHSFLNNSLTNLYYMPIIGYGFAWIGHFFFEKNKPATFIYPFYSLLGDWVMFKDILTGKVKL